MTDYTITPARYAKGQMVVRTIADGSGYKTRAAYLLEALNARYVGRSNGYVLSPAKADKFARLYDAGFDARMRMFHDSPSIFIAPDGREMTLREALKEIG